jgi:AAA family ATP:ADP antiporter
MKSYLQFYQELPNDVKKISKYIFLTYFFVLFSYPLVRSASSAIFYEAYSSNEYSFATFVSVVALMIMIGINNKFQNKYGVHKLYFGCGLLTIVALILAFIGYKSGIKEMAYVIFATKEAYIVLLVHTCLAFANAYYNLEQFKRVIGFIGAAGSLGGIIGGQLTKYLATTVGTDGVYFTSLFIILITVLFFLKTSDAVIKGLDRKISVTPIKAIRGVRKYVFLIASIVTLSQFVIYIADLQFNIVFEQVVTTKDARTAYLGDFYTYVNMVAIFLQFVVLPFALLKLESKQIFLFIPALYLILIFGGLSFGGGSLFLTGAVFVCMKGTDYSIFAAIKEVMYHPLFSLQKFGAKYITDMFIYRLSKAFIAIIMAQYLVNEMGFLNQLQFVFITLWVAAIILLFKEQKKLKH